jgi:alpha-glucosidase (family GH31 glycosyl hydrolase)
VFDFWTGQPQDGGRVIDRAVDLETTPIYARAGATIPMGPVKQSTAEPVDGPLSVTVYPGSDGMFQLFEDDGRSFEYRRGGWMGLTLGWTDRTRRLSVSLADGSRMRPPLVRDLEVRVAGSEAVRRGQFSGRPVTIQL